MRAFPARIRVVQLLVVFFGGKQHGTVRVATDVRILANHLIQCPQCVNVGKVRKLHRVCLRVGRT